MKNHFLLLKELFTDTPTGFCLLLHRYVQIIADIVHVHILSEDLINLEDRILKRHLIIFQAHKEVRDVLISGGDPLTLNDETLDYILSNIRSIEHVEIIRIGTRVPVVLPQRITDNLINILKNIIRFLSVCIFHILMRLLMNVQKPVINWLMEDFLWEARLFFLKGINDNVPYYERTDAQVAKDKGKTILSLSM
jgi:L-lysine 2,3-aminomutase